MATARATPAADALMYTTRIQKAAGALAETKLLLADWDAALSDQLNLERLHQDNVLGKATRARGHDVVFRTFKQRYLGDRYVLDALVYMAQGHVPAETFDRILYFLSARSDRLLHDLVVDVIAPKVYSYHPEITVDEVIDWLSRQIAAGRTESAWSEATTRRVARSLLAAARDFGLLEGRAKKRIRTLYLPTPAFAFIAFLLHRGTPAGNALLHHPDWRLFFLPLEGVERFFLESHQERLLDFYAAGPIVRIDFPATSAEEYARVIAAPAD